MDKRINFRAWRIDKKNIARALVIVFILMVLFPPYEMFSMFVKNTPVAIGFAFIGYLPECYNGNSCGGNMVKIDVFQLIGQFLIAIMIAVGVYFGFKSES
jgi:Ni,Fe-hydrogenase I cytochrome b subunit